MKNTDKRSSGQAMVIFAVTLLAMLLFVGLALDAGSLYVSYGQLKRAVDAAAVAAANDFKRGESLSRMELAAREVLSLHNVDIGGTDVHVYICDAYDIHGNPNPDGIRDAYLQTTVPEFYNKCPVTSAESPTSTQSPRKMVWVQATYRSPLYFLRLIGFDNVPLTTSATAEAAPIDLVIVIDVSESMSLNTTSPAYVPGNYDPSTCNFWDDPATADHALTPRPPEDAGACKPLSDAKIAAKALVDTLYQGYDQVGVITFDRYARVMSIPNRAGVGVDLSDDLNAVKDVVDTILVYDDAPTVKLWPFWTSNPRGGPLYNMVNFEDRDGNGEDADNGSGGGVRPCNPSVPADQPPNCCIVKPNRWDDSPVWDTLYHWGGIPCDDDGKLDSLDWNSDGIWAQTDDDASASWLGTHVYVGEPAPVLSDRSTCTGCGIREATNVLRRSARSGSVWIMIFLTDGNVNLSDTWYTSTSIDDNFPIGFCTGELLPTGSTPPIKPTGFWSNYCFDNNWDPKVVGCKLNYSENSANQKRYCRYCIDDDRIVTTTDDYKTCPPNTIYTSSNTALYSVLDYALDMTDTAALTRSLNQDEPGGNDIAIYTIALGNVGSTAGRLLRYMAAVGDDGDRESDPCDSVSADITINCGNYYFAPTGDALLPIFEDIASRIYTRITQ